MLSATIFYRDIGKRAPVLQAPWNDAMPLITNKLPGNDILSPLKTAKAQVIVA